MEEYIYDETNGLWYERDGDYYVPCLKLPETNVGVWGERYLTYIREHKKLLHTKLVINGTLYTHLAEINNQAEEMFSELVNQMKTNEGITEQLKAENQLEWVRRMNNIRSRATEIVNKDLIFR
ncbi:MAG: TnpV protein [Acutalibacteraceae bacterium]|nr:TnpV protein [Acutalibacteraceae bacterium]